MASSDHVSVQFVRIDADQAGQRIDNFLLTRLKGVPKSRIYRLLRKGEVRVNRGRIKPEYRLAAGDEIRIPPVRVSDRPAPAGPGQGLQKLLESAVLFENDQLMVLNKPAGLAVHGGTGINLGVIEALRAMRPEQHYLELVHRLDRDTSGCLLIAKRRSALRYLQEQMRTSAVRKTYQVLVKGVWDKGRTRVDLPLRKHTMKSGEWIVKAQADGKPSLTYFSVDRVYQDGSSHRATLLKAVLGTGRTHQIRVHTKMAGHPIAGDEKYGDNEFNRWCAARGLDRMFLHAAELAFSLPPEPNNQNEQAEAEQSTAQRLVVNAPLPEALQAFTDALGSTQIS